MHAEKKCMKSFQQKCENSFSSLQVFKKLSIIMIHLTIFPSKMIVVKKGQVIALLGKRCQDYDWVQGTSLPVPYSDMDVQVSKGGIKN